LGANYGTFSNYLVGSDGSDNAVDDITTLGGGLFYSTGLKDGIDVELKLPFSQVSQDDNTNTGLGTVEMALKYRAVSEGSGSPVSVSVYAGAATGAGHADSRGDMYNLGDGATSVVGGLGVGKLGFWSKGTWWAKANVQYHYRLALQTLDGQKVPADDIADDLEVGLQVHPRVGLAAGAHGFYRFGGYDIGSWPSELDSDLKWASLDAGALLAGGKALIYATDYTTVDIGVFKTVWAKNNPTDNLVASIGASVYFVP